MKNFVFFYLKLKSTNLRYLLKHIMCYKFICMSKYFKLWLKEKFITLSYFPGNRKMCIFSVLFAFDFVVMKTSNSRFELWANTQQMIVYTALFGT